MTRWKLTLGLLVLNAGLAALAALLILGAGPSTAWLPDSQQRATQVPVVNVVALPALADTLVKTTWQRPVFSPDRQPDLTLGTKKAQDLAQLKLTGVFISGTSQWAWISARDGRARKLRIGQSLEGGWTLSALSGSQATFTRSGQKHVMNIALARLPSPEKAPAKLILPVSTQ